MSNSDDQDCSQSNETVKNRRPVKRQRSFLFADFEKHYVTPQTRKKYKKTLEESQKKEKSPETSISPDSSDDELSRRSSFENSNDSIKDLDLEEDLSNVRVLHEVDETNDNIYPQDNLEQNRDDASQKSEEFNDSPNTIHPNEENNSIGEQGDESDEFEFSDSESFSEMSDIDDPDFYKDNADFDKIMFDSSNLTVREVIILVSAFSLRFQLSDVAKLELGNLLKLCAGEKFENLSLSKHEMSKCFSSQDENIFNYFYCSHCKKSIVCCIQATDKAKTKNATCAVCHKRECITALSQNYFMGINLIYQVQKLFMNEMILNDLIKNTVLKNKNSTAVAKTYSDVSDGSLYHKITATENNKIPVTFNWNLDGAPANKNKRSFWPNQMIINELSPKLRSRFILLTGILLTREEPKSNLMNLFINEILVKQLQKLNDRNLSVTLNGQKYYFEFKLYDAVVDSVARPIIQNRLQFNGNYGCSWCYHEGEYIRDAKGIRYSINKPSPIRTNESHIQHTLEASEDNIIRGCRGKSALMQLPYFDMVWSFCYEYMHGLLLGVILAMLNAWKSGKTKFKLSKENLKFIEARFLKITPTQEIHRTPRSGVLAGKAKPKGSELKTWALLYSLPCLEGVLDEDAFKHYSLLIKSAYTLLKDCITEEELNQCEKDLKQFVEDYEKHYLVDKMTFNVHTLLHAVESVRQLGPLCFNSAFPFESNIYNLKVFIKGPKGMDYQMARKHLQTLIFKTGSMNKIVSSQKVKNYCTDLFKHKKIQKADKIVSEDLTFVGIGRVVNLDLDNLNGNCLAYAKCIYKECTYHSIQYQRVSKTDDTVIKFKEKNAEPQFGRILYILRIDNKCYMHVKLFEVFPGQAFERIEHIYRIKREVEINTKTIPIECIVKKMNIVNVRHARFLSCLPNTIEIQ